MADTSKQSPLGVNVLGEFLNNQGLGINPVAESFIGRSKTNNDYTPGKLVNDTLLKWLTYAINSAYARKESLDLSSSVYNALISIGADSIPALGNAKPASYTDDDPSGVWTGVATTGFPISGNSGQGQGAKWLPYNTTNTDNDSITRWGYIRLHALQAWYEFNWHGSSVTLATPEYKEFLASYLTASGWVESMNQAILAVHNADSFLEKTFSNMNDMVSAEIAGVNLSTFNFGTDLVNLGKAISLSRIEKFGLPSNLLRTLKVNNAITRELTLALAASGLSNQDISEISSGTNTSITKRKEQQIYGAFLVIGGENLANVLAPLRCKTPNLQTLADLLNVKKLFPLSYRSMTVPIYNEVLGLPTNSKTYYLIYNGSEVNTDIDTPAVREAVGLRIFSDYPLESGKPTVTNTPKLPPKGFSGPIQGVIPDNQAIAAGAFSYSMLQISNIQTCDIEKFARTVRGIELVNDLPLVGGTDKPVNQSAVDSAKQKMALGSGPYGSYTMSDLFGSMSGLPYAWKNIFRRIKQLETSQLISIYQNLYLASQWEPATVSVQCTDDGLGNFTPVGLTLLNSGGGYGRDSSSSPVITLTNGGSGTAVIGTNPSDLATYGKVLSVTLTNPGPPAGSCPTATVGAPPGPGWPSMDSVITGYINQANSEINNIKNSQIYHKYLNADWKQLGEGLKREQRARFSAIDPVDIPKDNSLNILPVSHITFVDSISSLALNTRPHMDAQTLEAISILSTLGGQSLVALMREERNETRLNETGIELYNTIPDELSDIEAKTVTTNGILPGAISGIEGPDGRIWTPPAYPVNLDAEGNETQSIPKGKYDPSLPEFQRTTGEFREGDISAIIDGQDNPAITAQVSVGVLISEPVSPAQSFAISSPEEFDQLELPLNLNPKYTSSVLSVAVSDVDEAIERVIECNCDCWLT